MGKDKKILNNLGVLVVIATIIFITATNLVDETVYTEQQEKAVLDRIKPLGELATTLAEAQQASPIVEEPVVVAAEPMTAEQIYNRTCMACHATGVAGAPKIGDADAWAPRIAQGAETLFEHATKGFKGMPPRGGSSQLSDEDISAAIDYMVERSQ